jgi:hypothetical protein
LWPNNNYSLPKFKKVCETLSKNKKIVSVTVPSHTMALPLFVVSAADSEGVGVRWVIGRGLWSEISKELVATRLTKYSKTAFAI